MYAVEIVDQLPRCAWIIANRKGDGRNDPHRSWGHCPRNLIVAVKGKPEPIDKHAFAANPFKPWIGDLSCVKIPIGQEEG